MLYCWYFKLKRFVKKKSEETEKFSQIRHRNNKLRASVNNKLII